MKHIRWRLLFGLALVTLSAALYSIQISVFESRRDTFFYLFQDIAFVPVQILIVTLIVDRVLNAREKRILLEKMNMAIGVFFSETGTRLLKSLSALDSNGIGKELITGAELSKKQFAVLAKKIRAHDAGVDSHGADLDGLKGFLLDKRGFLTTLLQNPNLLEHDSFTELLMAVFHLTDELAFRDGFKGLPEADYRHLNGDIKRAYVLLMFEWVWYMRHLKDNYPYLYSLSVRTNPFNPAASAVVTE